MKLNIYKPNLRNIIAQNALGWYKVVTGVLMSVCLADPEMGFKNCPKTRQGIEIDYFYCDKKYYCCNGFIKCIITKISV